MQRGKRRRRCIWMKIRIDVSPWQKTFFSAVEQVANGSLKRIDGRTHCFLGSVRSAASFV